MNYVLELKAKWILLWPEASHRLSTLSLSILTFQWTCMRASPVSLSSDMLALSHVFSLLIAEKDLSQAHVVTGIVRNILNIHSMFGKKTMLVVWRVSSTVDGSGSVLDWNLYLHRLSSCSTVAASGRSCWYHWRSSASFSSVSFFRSAGTRYAATMAGSLLLANLLSSSLMMCSTKG